MKRLILALLGLPLLALLAGRAAAQHHHGGGGHGGGFGGHGGFGGPGGGAFHPMPIRRQGGIGMAHPGFGQYHPPAPAPAYHMPHPQYTAPSYHAPIAASSEYHSPHSGKTVSIPGSSRSFAPSRAGASGSAGTTVSLKQPYSSNGAGSKGLRPGSSGTTLSLPKRPVRATAGVAVGGKRPTELGKLPGQKKPPTALTKLPQPQRNGVNKLTSLVKSGAVRLASNALGLTGDPTGAIATFLGTPAGMSLPPVLQTILGDIANGQPLSGPQILAALAALPGLPPAVASAVGQGIVDNLVNGNNAGQLANNNGGQPGNNSPPGGILGMLGQLVQNLPNGGAGGLAGGIGGGVGGGAGAGFAGVGGGSFAGGGGGSGPVADDAPVAGAGTVDGPIVQDNTVPSSDGGATQPITPAVANTDAPPAGEQAVRQFRRYLQVKNDSSAKLTVYVQYSAFMDNGTFQWFPTRPGGDQAVAFTIAPGATVDVDHDGWRVKADRVRIWAVAADGTEVTDYRDRDLWLVAEQNGDRAYYAPDLEDFTFTFGR